MAKQVFYDDDARASRIGTVQALYNAVKVTYGPKGSQRGNFKELRWSNGDA